MQKHEIWKIAKSCTTPPVLDLLDFTLFCHKKWKNRKTRFFDFHKYMYQNCEIKKKSAKQDISVSTSTDAKCF